MHNDSSRNAPLAPPTDFSLARATVTGVAGAWFFIDGACADRALRAASCLLAPELGDLVLVSSGAAAPSAAGQQAPTLLGAAPFILAVLSRPEASCGVIEFPGGSRLLATPGGLQVAAPNIQLSASTRLELNSPELAVSAAKGTVLFGHLTTVAQAVQARLGSLHCIAQTSATVVNRLVVRAVNSFRQTEQLDDSRAGRVRMQVAERFALSAEHASVQAKGQVKIDGEKIDLG